jgi:hypothetical protein
MSGAIKMVAKESSYDRTGDILFAGLVAGPLWPVAALHGL